jgi:hypothetical protein
MRLRSAILVAATILAGCDGQHNVGSIEAGSKKACGGSNGGTCPLHEICVDDPTDSCDPTTGATCAGSCRKPTGPQCSPTLPTDAVCALILCGGGYKVVNGQTTCECCDTCPPVVCAIACQYGFKKDAAGCNLCQCEDAPPKCTTPNPQGCTNTGCPSGQTCDVTVGCAPSTCGCDATTGGWICTADCSGGTCVPDTGACPPVACALACQYGFKKNAAGCEICDCNPAPATGQCVRNSNDTCKTDADCRSGGCGGELCYNPAVSQGITTCDCTAPTGVGGCGCVAGSCTWWK